MHFSLKAFLSIFNPCDPESIGVKIDETEVLGNNHVKPKLGLNSRVISGVILFYTFQSRISLVNFPKFIGELIKLKF